MVFEAGDEFCSCGLGCLPGSALMWPPEEGIMPAGSVCMLGLPVMLWAMMKVCGPGVPVLATMPVLVKVYVGAMLL